MTKKSKKVIETEQEPNEIIEEKNETLEQPQDGTLEVDIPNENETNEEENNEIEDKSDIK